MEKKPDTKRRAAHRYGLKAEWLAAHYLRCKGYRIISTRYRNHAGEIDIIAAKARSIIAVEVKARQSINDCAETVPPHKQQKIARALEGFLGSYGAKSAGLGTPQPDNIRFDVIWMAPRRWPVHIKDAWRL